MQKPTKRGGRRGRVDSKPGKGRRNARSRCSHASRTDVRVEAPKQYAWELLDRLVTDLSEWLPESDQVLVSGIARSRNFARYLALGERWGLQSINNSNPEFATPEMAAKLLLGAVIKKYPFSGSDTVKRDAALEVVRATNRTCSVFNRTGWKRLFVDGRPSVELRFMREFVERVIGFNLPEEAGLLTEWSRHGPGSDTATLLRRISKYDKYSEWPYRVTARSREYARRFIISDERWFGALEDSYRRRNHIPMWSILNWDVFWQDVFVETDTNRITTVPKDGQKDRPIAIEPRLNLMLQLGVDGFVRRRLKRWGINLDSQEKNQRLAYLGSVRTDADCPVTIDLSNASDTVSLRLVKLLFPKDWYEYLCDLRCPNGILPGQAKLRYSKLSSMGNGYTFAIESLIFGAACYAAMKVSGLRWDQEVVSVFGDDIIVPQSACAPLMNLLHVCGFSLNQDKSFVHGNVRESCGTDWVAGTNVRPVLVDTVPHTVCDFYVHRNQLKRWAQLHLACTLDATESYLISKIPESLRLWGPLSDKEYGSYLHTEVPCGWTTKSSGKKTAWSYHHEYVSCRIKPQRAHDFLFRKLMHELRPTGEVENQWTKRKLVSGGSRFTVSLRDSVVYSVGVRCTPIWSSEYNGAYDWESAC